MAHKKLNISYNQQLTGCILFVKNPWKKYQKIKY